MVHLWCEMMFQIFIINHKHKVKLEFDVDIENPHTCRCMQYIFSCVYIFSASIYIGLRHFGLLERFV